LSPDRLGADVRDAQRPVEGGPKPLKPVSYQERALNWANLVYLVPMWVAISITSMANMAEVAVLGLAVIGAFLVLSYLLHLWRNRAGRAPAVTLSAKGLEMPHQFKDPIPWSKVGRVERTYGPLMRWTSVHIDKDHRAIILAPSPLNLLPEEKRKSTVPMVILSSWNLAVEMDDLVADVSRFRDNYCTA